MFALQFELRATSHQGQRSDFRPFDQHIQDRSIRQIYIFNFDLEFAVAVDELLVAEAVPRGVV